MFSTKLLWCSLIWISAANITWLLTKYLIKINVKLTLRIFYINKKYCFKHNINIRCWTGYLLRITAQFWEISKNKYGNWQYLITKTDKRIWPHTIIRFAMFIMPWEYFHSKDSYRICDRFFGSQCHLRTCSCETWFVFKY